MDTQKIPIRMPIDLRKKLTQVAESCAMSESEVIIRSIRSFLKIVGQDKINALYYILENFKLYQESKSESALSFRCPIAMLDQLDVLDNNRSRIINQIIAWRLTSVKIIPPPVINASEIDKKELSKDPLKLLAKCEQDIKHLEKHLNK